MDERATAQAFEAATNERAPTGVWSEPFKQVRYPEPLARLDCRRTRLPTGQIERSPRAGLSVIGRLRGSLDLLRLGCRVVLVGL
jgi:hypothetical protein